MKKMLCLLVAILLIPAALAEAACPVCGGTSDLCLTDEVGAVYCAGKLISYPAEALNHTYTVREGTCTIGDWAFCENWHLEEVILPEGVVMIGTGAFEGRLFLKRVTLPESLLIIGDSAFSNCPELADVTLPPKLYAIGPSAFVDCRKLTGLDIPETVRYIGSEAFCNTGLTEIWLRTIDLECGDHILHPGFQNDPPQPVTIHVSEELLYDEVGNLANFMDVYDEKYNVTYVYDVPYLD
ncbi:MAG: leucine-rich repeat domain-containing protein [Clostridia bacterium]|nr:leucine-rich repeat domain-containing protein [Clostridia bacterium]